MSPARPFLARLVVAAPVRRLGDLAAWARAMTEAGADGLALRADPGDPAGAGLLRALRRATPLPVELEAPEDRPVDPAWAAILAEAETDWLLPGQVPSEEAARALAEAGIAWAWPVAAGTAPDGARRLHGRGALGSEAWRAGPETAERSLAPEPGGKAPGFAESGADTLILPGEVLTPADPAASLAERRA